jgi:hypothetical protein
MTIALKLLLWLIPIGLNVYADKDGRKPNYLMMFVLRGAAAIIHGVLFNPQNMTDYWPLFLFQVTSFWLIFEIALNIVRGREVFYYDRKEKDSGWIDRLFAWAGPVWHFIAKLITFALMVWSIILIYKRN